MTSINRAKADHEWELAGLARRDGDYTAERIHTARARAYELGDNPDANPDATVPDGSLRWASPPAGVFSGVNIMTPSIVGYVKLAPGLGWAELSNGTGIYREPIFGVAVRDTGNVDPHKLSKLFYSRKEAEQYIRLLVIGDAGAARELARGEE